MEKKIRVSVGRKTLREVGGSIGKAVERDTEELI